MTALSLIIGIVVLLGGLLLPLGSSVWCLIALIRMISAGSKRKTEPEVYTDALAASRKTHFIIALAVTVLMWVVFAALIALLIMLGM